VEFCVFRLRLQQDGDVRVFFLNFAGINCMARQSNGDKGLFQVIQWCEKRRYPPQLPF